MPGAVLDLHHSSLGRNENKWETISKVSEQAQHNALCIVPILLSVACTWNDFPCTQGIINLWCVCICKWNKWCYRFASAPLETTWTHIISPVAAKKMNHFLRLGKYKTQKVGKWYDMQQQLGLGGYLSSSSHCPCLVDCCVVGDGCCHCHHLIIIIIITRNASNHKVGCCVKK